MRNDHLDPNKPINTAKAVKAVEPLHNFVITQCGEPEPGHELIGHEKWMTRNDSLVNGDYLKDPQ